MAATDASAAPQGRLRQAASAEILRAIAASPGDAQRSLQQIAETTERLFGASAVTIRIAGDGDAQELSFPAAVEVVERLGSEILLDVAVGQATMVASVEPTATAKVHETLRLAVNPNRVHFFDNETEAAI